MLIRFFATKVIYCEFFKLVTSYIDIGTYGAKTGIRPPRPQQPTPEPYWRDATKFGAVAALNGHRSTATERRAFTVRFPRACLVLLRRARARLRCFEEAASLFSGLCSESIC